SGELQNIIANYIQATAGELANEEQDLEQILDALLDAEKRELIRIKLPKGRTISGKDIFK
ncbi:UNVERIFIED_CONTAM: hypothetical protein RF648_19390, partial [Kocuria sp. CPCC 205274]